MRHGENFSREAVGWFTGWKSRRRTNSSKGNMDNIASRRKLRIADQGPPSSPGQVCPLRQKGVTATRIDPRCDCKVEVVAWDLVGKGNWSAPSTYLLARTFDKY